MHDQLALMSISTSLDTLPATITRMTDRNSSTRLCSVHTTFALLRRPNLACSHCAHIATCDLEKHVKQDGCLSPVFQSIPRVRDGLSQLSFDSTKAQILEPHPIRNGRYDMLDSGKFYILVFGDNAHRSKISL
jgi:hypothetical protein